MTLFHHLVGRLALCARPLGFHRLEATQQIPAGDQADEATGLDDQEAPIASGGESGGEREQVLVRRDGIELLRHVVADVAGRPAFFESCCDGSFPDAIQECATSSQIWARPLAEPGVGSALAAGFAAFALLHAKGRARSGA